MDKNLEYDSVFLERWQRLRTLSCCRKHGTFSEYRGENWRKETDQEDDRWERIVEILF